MDMVDLIVTIARKYKESVGIALGKTKLLKLAYLAEIYYKRLMGKRLTDQQWVFWKYGPYLWEYEAMISNEEIFLKQDEADEFYPVEVSSYKNRHSQRYVLSDQMLQIPHRFYFPPGNPGLHEECAGLINELQCIPETNLYPWKCFCDIRDPQMDRPIQLCDKAFHAVVGHIAQFLPEVTISDESLEWYGFFRDLLDEEISKVLLP